MSSGRTSPLTLGDAYRRDGYAIIREAMPSSVITAARAQLDALIAGLAPDERPENLVEPHVRAPDWRFWLELCRHPAVVDRVAECLGAHEIILLMSHLIVKPARDGLAVEWHQDNTYWPSVTGTDVTTVWLALDDVDTGNACMRIIPRSQVGYPELEKLPTDGTDLLNVRVEVSAAQEASAVPIELARGEFSLHDSFAIHGSHANRGDRRRAGYTMRYADASTVRVALERHWNPVYYVRGDGRALLPGMRDLRPGRELPTTPADARGSGPMDGAA
ncbi:MAG TPA: phytanoyl-CoA dioxygenase family protein [Planctomycetota bacterium]|nr:phytanoyl-CoA dioxygenase family protein [Planctomycetota bacterium]